MLNRPSRSLSRLIRPLDLLGNFLLIFLPIPLGPLRRKISGSQGKDRVLEFYSHPNFVCVLHLIWLGWLLAGVGLYNDQARENDWWLVPMQPLSWLWVLTLMLTLIVLGLQFNRVACGFLGGTVLIFLLGVYLIETKAQLPLIGDSLDFLGKIPILVDWGVPAVISAVMGVIFTGVVTWHRLNDRWILREFGNYIENINFQDRDSSIPKGAKNIVAVSRCLIRRYLFFGLGDIEVRSSVGGRQLHRIEGVFFAAELAEAIKRRLSKLDVAMAVEEEELSEEEEDDFESA